MTNFEHATFLVHMLSCQNGAKVFFFYCSNTVPKQNLLESIAIHWTQYINLIVGHLCLARLQFELETAG